MRFARYFEVAQEAVHTHDAHQSARELAELLGLVDVDPPERILEIGSHTGGSLWAWRQVWPQARIVAVDVTFAQLRDPSLAVCVHGDSHEAATLHAAESQCGGPVDFLFIDGDHTYMGVRRDWEMYSPLCRPGALVAFHDIHPGYLDGGINRLWTEVRDSSLTTLEISRNVPSSDDLHPTPCCGIGVVRLP